MQFTLVIFSTYEFFVESLANANLTQSFFMYKKDEVFNKSYFFQMKSNFKIKEFFFTSPQLKNTLFNIVIAQLIFSFFFAMRALITKYRSPLIEER